jgi:energy-coupling factor transporter ATP-binding protein EcfA2
MARIPESEIERLKLQVSVVRLVEAAGVALKPHGKDLVGRCPFHDDRTPSLVVSPKTNLWHCLGACQMGGSAIDWVMRFENVPFRRAVELLRHQLGAAPALSDATPARPAQIEPQITSEPPSSPGAVKGLRRLLQAESSALASADERALLMRVLAYYHETLKRSPEALAYLAQRGLDHPEVIDHFQLGFANRTLGYRLPDMATKSGAAIRGALARIGIYRGTGHEHFNGSLVVPVLGLDGQATEVYGRKVTRATKLREGTPLHLYLPGPHVGVFNEAGLVGQGEVILCEALIDALTFWCAGFRNVTSSYGIEGFTPDILAALKRHEVQRVLIAYDADDAGNAAAEKLAVTLIGEGFGCYRIRFPKGMDANEYAVQGCTNAAGAGCAGVAVKPVAQSLGLVMRQAEWMGNGVAPRRDEVPTVSRQEASPIAEAVAPTAPAPIPSLVAALAPEFPAPVDLPPFAVDEVPIDPLPATPAAPLPREIAATIDEREVVIERGDRRYRVRGLSKGAGEESMKVNVRVSRAAQGCASAAGAGCAGAAGDRFHLDTLDLYQAKARAAFVAQASIELDVEPALVKADLGAVLGALEQAQDARARAAAAPKVAALPNLSPAQHEAALALLRDPNLVERIVADVAATGVVGEASNALVAYLACVSRKLDKPLAILIQSTSAAGKSTLMDALLALMPESERVHYSAMTGQSLFYLGETSMKHKILAIAEEEGVRQAAYALKLLQSQGELTIASTGKDPATGQLVTQEYRVEGPVMLFLTTTAIDIDEELLNRCLVLTIDESREQTAAILSAQRAARTLDGLLAKVRREEVLATHRAAQQLLRPLAVVNPYAQSLTFATERVRLRRDHAKYLALIDAIALLHQYQRPVRVAGHGERAVEYVEATVADIALANRLAHEVLGRSLDELPPQTRRVLGQVQAMVALRAAALGCEPSVVRFTRRELREHTGLSLAQLAVHVDRLRALEYLIAHAGRNGQRFVYELAFDGPVEAADRRLPGLIDAARIEATTANLPDSGTDLPVDCRPAAGVLPSVAIITESGVSAGESADLFPLVAALPLAAHRGARAERRRNGAGEHANGAAP